MDITSPITLWKDYDVSALPINASPLSEKTENGIAVKEYYFDGYTTVDGRVRAYIKIYEHSESKGVVLYLCDSNGFDIDMISTLHGFGYTVAALDYLGKSDNQRYTLYPRSLSSCNLFGVKTFIVTENDKLNNWYIWTCVARRACKLLTELYTNQKLVALGVGLGGNTVYKLASFDDGAVACATLLNIMPNVDGTGNSLINYRASLDSSAYATFCKIPMFMALASNDCDGSLDAMAELAKNTESLKHFKIIERAFSCGICSAFDDLNRFFQARINNLPDDPRPVITASNSEGNLYFNIDINGIENYDGEIKQELFVSFCIDDPTFRNWMKLPTISLGKDKYISHINVCQNDKKIYAFANIILENGTSQSSILIDVLPKSLGIKAHAGVNHRRIYDGSMGYDGWTSRKGGKISLVKGPFDIDGITSDSNSLITFKLGDPLFQVTPDTLLQIMISGQPQTLNIKVSSKNETFSTQVKLKNENEWDQFSLSHMNFKGENGTLQNWSDILLLEFDSDRQFIVGSVIWV